MIANNPKADGERIKSLMERVEKGDIKIPKFQRGYVWKQRNILELLDSLYKGYPIGSLLFWRTTTKIQGERNIGGYDLPSTNEVYPTNYVLDGQQRLTTIYSVFANRDSHPGMDAIFDIAFDFNTETFVQEKQASAESIPLYSLFDNRAFRALTRDFENDIADKAAELQEIFMNYEVPIVTIFNMDIEEVATIFERINSTGKTLTVFDLMVAATWSERFDLRDEIEILKNELEDKNYNNLPDITILKCLSVVLGESQTKKSIFSLRNKDSNELRAGIQKTKYGLFRAIDFLTGELSVSSSDFLPYDFQIVLLTYFFAKVSIPKPEMITTLKKWFWRSSFAERYQGANDTLLEGDINDCKKLSDNNISDIFEFSFEGTINKIMRTEFKKGTAFSNAIISLLAMNRPKNLITGTFIDVVNSLSSYNRKEFHHVFPRRFLKDKNVKYNPNSICNIIILSSNENKRIGAKAPSKYFSEIKFTLGSEYIAVLKSNILPPDEASGIMENDYDFFVEMRAEIIIDKIRSVI